MTARGTARAARPVVLPEERTVRIERRVLYADTDRMGVAYYANYLRWFEEGRAEFLRARGLPYSEIEGRGYLLPVTEAHCTYLASARYDERVAIATGVTEVRRASLVFGYRLTRVDDGVCLAVGTTHHVCMTPDGAIHRLPDPLRAALAADAPGSAGRGG